MEACLMSAHHVLGGDAFFFIYHLRPPQLSARPAICRLPSIRSPISGAHRIESNETARL